MIVKPTVSKSDWDAFITDNGGHPLQLWGWGEVKARHGWRVDRVFIENDGVIIAAAQILIRLLPWPLQSLAYIPRGPVLKAPDDSRDVLDILGQYTKETYKSVCLRIEPHARQMELSSSWRRTDSTILLPHTLLLDLTKSEDELLSVIPAKRRYDIRKSTKDVASLSVVSPSDINKVLEVYKATANRAGFLLHNDEYYYDISREMTAGSVVIGAHDESGELLAFTWFAVTPQIAFELYSGITKKGQQLRANYGLKWYAITYMKQKGVKEYDFNGLLNDGISDFKRNFSNEDTVLMGTFELPLSTWYPVWGKGLPVARILTRKLRSLLRR